MNIKDKLLDMLLSILNRTDDGLESIIKVFTALDAKLDALTVKLEAEADQTRQEITESFARQEEAVLNETEIRQGLHEKIESVVNEKDRAARIKKNVKKLTD